MHITLETDYAIRIMLYLLRCEKRADAALISEETQVTLRFSLKILRKLVAGGLVRSYKGAMGGYEAAKAPKDVSLADVVGIIEGTYLLSRCLNPEVGCSRGMEASCEVHSVFAKISDTVQKMLAETTFDQLLKPDLETSIKL